MTRKARKRAAGPLEILYRAVKRDITDALARSAWADALEEAGRDKDAAIQRRLAAAGVLACPGEGALLRHHLRLSADEPIPPLQVRRRGGTDPGRILDVRHRDRSISVYVVWHPTHLYWFTWADVTSPWPDACEGESFAWAVEKLPCREIS